MAVDKKKVTSGDIAFKKLEALWKRVLQFVQDWKTAQLIDDKVAIYTSMMNILNKAVKLFFKQNVNTFTNKLYFDIIRQVIRETKADYQAQKAKIMAECEGEGKYKYQINKLNDLIKDVEELAKKMSKSPKGDSKLIVEKLQAIQKNKALRGKSIKEVDLLPAFDTMRKNALRAKHVEAIYSSIIKPIIDYLIKEGAVDETKANTIQKILLDSAKHGYIKDDKVEMSAKVKVWYWPKEAVLNDANKFGYKGNVWLVYTEAIEYAKKSSEDSKDTKKVNEVHFNSSAEYVEAFRNAITNFKQSQWKDTGTAKTRVFYPLFLSKVLEDNKYLAKNLENLFNKMADKLEKDGANKKAVEEIRTVNKKMCEVIIGNTYVFTSQIVVQGGREYQSFKVTRKEAPKVEKKLAPKKVEKKAPVTKKNPKMPSHLDDL